MNINKLQDLMEILEYRGNYQGEKTAYTFITDKGNVSITYAELLAKVKKMAFTLKNAGSTNNRVLILYPSSLEFIITFFACLYINYVAIPCYPITKTSKKDRLEYILKDANPGIIVQKNREEVEWIKEELPHVKWINDEYMKNNPGETRGVTHQVNEESIAFLQYTSGSTSNPKGVMVSNKNIMCNSEIIKNSFELTEESRGLIWLPPFHDMGLIGGIIGSLYVGYHLYLMTAFRFVRRPFCWLEAISKYKITASGGPDFAYDLCTQKISEEEKSHLDLSSWITAFNGAEPVKKKTLDNFYNAFKDCGFKYEAFYPCYGLAEATLLVAGSKNGVKPSTVSFNKTAIENGQVLKSAGDEANEYNYISSGFPAMGQETVIVNPETLERCRENEIGEIWIKGASITKGYLNKEKETKENFQAYIKSTEEGPFLRTGDLGFFFEEQLYVTGRIKDLIIIRGKNYYPQDIESAVANCSENLDPGSCVAFSIKVQDEEELVIVQEIAREKRKSKIDLDNLRKKVRKIVYENFQVRLYDLVIVQPREVPKTTSGKLQRKASKTKYLNKEFKVIEDILKPVKPVVKQSNYLLDSVNKISDLGMKKTLINIELLAKIKELTNELEEDISIEDSLSSLGMDSIKIVEFSHVIEKEFAVKIPIQEFFDEVSIDDISEKIALNLPDNHEETKVAAPMEENQVFPLSKGQKALWFLYKLDKKSIAYNIASAMYLNFEVDVEKFTKAYEYLLKQHPMLKVRLEEVNNEIVQKICEDDNKIKIYDATSWSESEVKKFLNEKANSPFNLTKESLIKIYLLKDKNDKYIMLLVMHHIITDFWSLSVIARDLINNYLSLLKEQVLPVQQKGSYKKFIEWQEDFVDSDEGKEEVKFWQNYLKDVKQQLDFPLDNPRKVYQSFSGKTYGYKIDKKLLDSLINFSKEKDTTLFTTLLAVFYTLIYRYTNEKDLCFGVPFAARNTADFSDLVGYCVNTLPVRVKIEEEDDFASLLKKVKGSLLSVLEHQYYPFSSILENMKVSRDNSYTPIFQMMFVYQESLFNENKDFSAFALGVDGYKINFQNIELQSIGLDNLGAQFDLTIMIADTKSGLDLQLNYNDDILKEDTIKNLIELYVNLLKNISNYYDENLKKIQLLPERSIKKVLNVWNDTQRETDYHNLVFKMIEKQAEKFPNKAALICNDETLSYADLNERSEKIAAYLIELGAAKEMPISVCLDRSFELVICILGILKAGATYVPIDMSYPQDRIDFMLKDCGNNIILTKEKFKDRITHSIEAKVVLVDKDLEKINKAAKVKEEISVSPEDSCYIIYTSGSTGKPKGVVIKHGAFVNLISSVVEKVDFSPNKKMISLTSMCFDIFSIDTITPLTQGLTVVLTNDLENKEPNEIVKLIKKYKVQMMQTTPSRYKTLLSCEDKGRFLSGMTDVLVAGEQFTYWLLKELGKYENLNIYNFYGPTETTIYSTGCKLEKEDKITIGKPILNTYIYILNDSLQLQPTGVVGEIYISGAGVAKGYLNRPELTSEKFKPDPFRKGYTMYKSGDLGRWTVEGNIECLGRIDNQVKIHGFRIEIDEIENRLLKCKNIDDAVVVAKYDPNGEKYICAYVVSKEKILVNDLYLSLGKWLPKYMIPAKFIQVTELPMTPNGKVNRKELSSLEDRTYLVDEYLEPVNETEEKIAKIWKEILCVDKVSTNVNFFVCGGDSLKAVTLVNHLKDEFKTEIHLRDIFKYQSIKEQSSFIKDLHDVESSKKNFLVVKDNSNQEYFSASMSQKRVFITNSLDNSKVTYNMPGVLEITSDHVDFNKIEDIFRKLIARHESLRTCFKVIDGEIYQKVQDKVEFNLQYEKIKKANLQFIMEEFIQPFNLEIAPLLRVKLVEDEEDKQLILIDFNHIIADGMSINILIEEFVKLYNDEVLEELKYQYRDFVKWQSQLYKSDYIKPKEEYWMDLFNNTQPYFELPVDFSRPTEVNYAGNYLKFSLDKELTQRLQTLANETNSTLYHVLLTAFNIFLSKVSNNKEVTIGTLIAGRQLYQWENIIGMFVNTLPLKNILEDEESFLELLNKVKVNYLDSFDNQEYQFEQLAKKLNLYSTASANPLINVVFNYHNSKIKEIKTKQIKLNIKEIKHKIAKFDLTLDAVLENNKLFFEFEYRTCLFKESTIRNFVNCYINILKEILEDENKQLKDIELVSQEEKEKFKAVFNENNKVMPGKTILSLFKKQVKLNPEKTAVISSEESFSYQELDESSDKIRNLLISAGIKPKDVVGFVTNRNCNLVSCLLGILKANAICMPIDKNYPESRKDFLIEDSNCKVILKDEEDCISTRFKVRELNIKEEPVLLEDYKEEIAVEEKQPAYIVYTSGSTGLPKGVLLNNQGIINHAFTKIAETKMNKDSILAHSLNVNFVASIWQVFSPLFIGATLVILPEDTIRNPYKLFAETSAHRITILEVVPSFLDSYLELINDGSAKIDLSDLSCILLTGEKVSEGLVNKFYSIYDNELINAYGQSECSDDTLHYHIPYNKNTQKVFIGKPSLNTRVYVLDKNLKLMPEGLEGELFISGAGVAEGYLNREELTKEKFIKDPFKSGEVMFKTGDNVKWYANGNIEYIGRCDSLVKINGLRIELGEIESSILEYPSIKKAVVTVTADNNLSAFYVAKEEIAEEDLVSYLQDRLPAYMVPIHYKKLLNIPLNSNGKIDYKQLKTMFNQPEKAKEYIAPANEIEKTIAAIWEELLNVKHVGANDDFFKLGGDSLSVFRIINKINKELKVEIPFKEFFRLSTVRNIGNYVLNHQEYKKINKETVTAFNKADDIHKPFPLTEIQEAYLFGRKKGMQLGNIAAHAYLEIDFNNLNLADFNYALNKIIERHLMLRSVILTDGSQKILENIPEYKVKVIDLSKEEESVKKERLIDIRQEMSHEVLDTEKWPLFNIKILKLTDERSIIHISIDMLIIDALSLRILLKDLNFYYRNREKKLPRLDFSYKDYVMYCLADKERHLSEHNSYIKKRADQLFSAPELPLIKKMEEVKKPVFKRRTSKLNKAEWSVIKEIAAENKCTPTSILLAAYAKVISFWSKNKEFTLNITLFNRPFINEQINELVGDFTSLILLPVSLSGNNSFVEFARGLQDEMMDCIDHRNVSSTEILREYSKKNNKLGSIMPVVFTSIMYKDKEENLFEENISYAISQTPQVWIDNQVTEYKEEVLINWDTLDELFPENFIDDLFKAYVELLRRLATSKELWEKSIQNLVEVPSYQLAIIENREDKIKELHVQLLHDKFLHNAKENPEDIAVISSEMTLTYGEVYTFADKVKSWIIKNKTSDGRIAAVILDKGWEEIVSVLGILMAGMTYIPIAPDTPAERIKVILKNSATDLIICNDSYLDKIAALTNKPVLGIENAESLRRIESIEGVVERSVDDLAYIIYTSGSTGEPKGVMISHKGAVNTIEDINSRFNVTSKDRILQLSALNFDLSVYDIFGMLSAGGAIVLPDKQHLLDPSYWLKLMKENAISIWNTVPAYMDMLIEYLVGHSIGDLNLLRLVLLSGDKISRDLPGKIYERFKEVEVISLGGATEASIWSIIYSIDKDYNRKVDIPYGHAMYNQTCYVMDEYFNIRPIGLEGEIYIGGIGVAQGYLNDKTKTCERFVINPKTKERLYKTGDLGRYLPDGNIAFVGRKDFMVKIRGYRIELGEVESALNSHQDIEKSVVSVLEDNGQKQLVAYIVPKKDARKRENKELITNPIDRLKFKLAHHNINKVQSEVEISLREENKQAEIINKYVKRKSFRKFCQDKIPFEKFCAFINTLMSEKFDGYPLPKYQYASAGSLYPVRVYIYVKEDKIEGINEGIYYYNPMSCKLIKVSSEEGRIVKEDYAEANKEIFASGAFSLYLVADMNSIMPMYGSWSKDFCLIEVGMICQLLEKAAFENNIGLCQIGGFDFKKVRKNFALADNEVYLHSLIGGFVDYDQATIESLIEENKENIKLIKEVEGIEDKSARKEIDVDKEKKGLKEYLQDFLPSYMIPHNFVEIDEIPLSANGKVDYKQLSKLGIPKKSNKTNDKVKELNNEVEKIIYSSWKKTLKREDFGTDDGFFDIGGTSVQLIQIHQEISQYFKIDFPIVKMFEYTSVTSLSNYLEALINKDKSTTEDEITSRKETMREVKLNKYKNNMRRRRRDSE